MTFPRVLSHFRSLCRVLKMRQQPALSKATLRLLQNVTWETHIPTDMRSPTWKTNIPSNRCSPTCETHIPSYMCSLTWETHIPSDMCSPTWQTLPLMLCVPQPGKHASLVICLPPLFPHLANTYH